MRKLCYNSNFLNIFLNPQLRMFIDLRERERERETLIGCLPFAPQPGVKPATYVCALTGNQATHFLMYEKMFQATESPGPGYNSHPIDKEMGLR